MVLGVQLPLGKRSSSAVVAILVSIATSTAFAQAPASESKPTVTLRPADADGDGVITKAEWTRMAQSFSRLDANRDGAVDLAELQAAAGDGTSVPAFFAVADTDANGKLVRAEWSKLVLSFARWDTNKDGALVAAEIPQPVGTSTKDSATAASTAAPSPIDKGPQLWRGWIVDGRGETPDSGQMQIELYIEGNRIVGREVGAEASPYRQGLGAGTFLMTGNGKQGNLDAMYTEGPHSGQTCLGIFQMEGDRLRWCASNRDGYRPQEFATGSGCWLMLLQKVPNPK